MKSDLTTFPGWKVADAQTRRRILDERPENTYVKLMKQGTCWLGKKYSFTSPRFAGYRALRLLLKEDPQSLAGIPVEVWRRWPAIYLGPSRAGREATKRRKKTLLTTSNISMPPGSDR